MGMIERMKVAIAQEKFAKQVASQKPPLVEEKPKPLPSAEPTRAETAKKQKQPRSEKSPPKPKGPAQPVPTPPKTLKGISQLSKGKRPRWARVWSVEELAAKEAVNGRLPVGSAINSKWTGETWEVVLKLYDSAGELVKELLYSNTALFKGLQFMDRGFWQWYLQAGLDEQVRLVWAISTPEAEL